MATISKFYFHDAATTNTGIMPGAGDAFAGHGSTSADVTGDATNARTARSANDVIGLAETNSVITSTANQLGQAWGHRRFVSAPIAAHTFATADGNWTLSCAAAESNTLHNGLIQCYVSLWRPSAGGFVNGAIGAGPFVGLTATAKTALSAAGSSAAWNGTQACLDGDVLVFEIFDSFTQGMSVAYTSTFYYDGTTEASTTSCASFVTPPAALTLFTAPVPATPLPLHQSVPFYPRASRPS